jgi:hypothetical protein
MKKITLFFGLILMSFYSLAQNIDAVYFAQTHVVASDYLIPMANEKLKLISDRAALIKAQITAPGNIVSPIVRAKLDLNGAVLFINLTGPSTLPSSFNATLGQVDHKFDDSFTGIIPKEWIQPNLEITIEAGTNTPLYDNLAISAPNKIRMTNFEVNAFTEQNSEFPSGWEEEFAEKLPASEFIVQNVRVLFKDVSIPPTGGRIAARISNAAEYQTLTASTVFFWI